jgi:hypothetical protein
MKIALFRYISPSMSDVVSVREESMEKYSTDLVRVSEYIEIDFPPRVDVEGIQKQADAIAKEIEAVTARRDKEIADLNHKKTEVLSLVFSPEVEVA